MLPIGVGECVSAPGLGSQSRASIALIRFAPKAAVACLSAAIWCLSDHCALRLGACLHLRGRVASWPVERRCARPCPRV